MLLFSVEPRYDMQVQLVVPEDNEECPMMLMNMKDCELDFALGQQVIESEPLKTKMVLPCGHSFSAMPTLYHFCKSGLKCPMCRNGVDATLDYECLPIHLVWLMRNHVEKKRREDQAEEELQNYRDTIAMVFQDIEEDFSVFSESNTISLVAYCYDSVDSLVPLVSFSYEMQSRMQGDEIQFYLGRAALRDLCRSLHHLAPLQCVQLAVGVQGASRDFIFLDRSDKIKFTDFSQNTIVLGRGYGQYLINAVKSDVGIEDIQTIVGLQWNITTENFFQWVHGQGVMLFTHM